MYVISQTQTCSGRTTRSPSPTSSGSASSVRASFGYPSLEPADQKAEPRTWELGADVIYAGERRDFGFPDPVRLSSYWLAGLSARVDIGGRWTLRARMENLFDEPYELADGYNSMGRSLFVTLRHEFH